MKEFQIQQLVEKSLCRLKEKDAHGGKANELVTTTEEELSQADQSFPCVVVIGDEAPVKEHCPVENYAFPEDATGVVVRFRPGDAYEETRHAKKSASAQFIDVQTPELTDHAIVLIPDGLDLTNHIKAASFFPVVACADAIIITTAKRLTIREVNTLDLFLSMLKHLLSQMGRQQIPLAYLHYSEGVDPQEATEINEANQASLAAAEMMTENFEFYTRDINDAGYREYSEWVTAICGNTLSECYEELAKRFTARISSTCTHYEETISQLKMQREKRVDYDTLKKQSLEISRQIRSSEYKAPQRALYDVLAGGRHDLGNHFRTIENGSATIYSAASEIIASVKTEADAEAALYAVNKLMGEGTVSAIMGVLSQQNSRLMELGATTVTTLSKKIEEVGLPTFRPHFSHVGIQTPTAAEIKTLNPLLASSSELAWRHGISSFMGLSIVTAAVKTGIELGLISGSFGTPPMMFACALIGAGSGLIISIASMNSQKTRAIHAEFDKKVRELLSVLSAQASKVHEDFSKTWTYVFEDALSAIFDAADRHIHDELSKYEGFASKTRPELDAMILEYEAYVACLKDILKSFDDLEEASATPSE